MVTSVSMVQKYGTHYDGTPLPYMSEESRRVSQYGGNKYLLTQSKNDRGAITQLYKNGVLIREKLNVPSGIYRDCYSCGAKVSNSFIPKGNGNFYFNKRLRLGQELTDVMSGYLYKGSLLNMPKVNLAEALGHNNFCVLGGGSKRIWGKILGYLSKIK